MLSLFTSLSLKQASLIYGIPSFPSLVSIISLRSFFFVNFADEADIEDISDRFLWKDWGLTASTRDAKILGEKVNKN